MSLCNSIDTLSMAFLDDELAAEERRELELHLLDCASCRQQVDRERTDLSLVRKALVAPPASAMLKARIARALDAEDVALARSKRRRWSAWVLPGSAIAAAAAAILLFVGAGVGPSASGDDDSAIARDVAKQQTRPLPLEVQGPTTRVWMRDNGYDEPPQFTEPGIDLLGARLLPNGIANHDAAMIKYRVSNGRDQVTLTAILLKDLRSEELGGRPYRRSDGLVLRLHDAGEVPAVSYIDPRTNVGYVFAARMDPEDLLRLVFSTDLLARAQQVR